MFVLIVKGYFFMLSEFRMSKLPPVAYAVYHKDSFCSPQSTHQTVPVKLDVDKRANPENLIIEFKTKPLH